MGRYEELLMQCEIEVTETQRVPRGFDGWYQDNEIFIRPSLSETRKAEVLYEELAHHKLTYGNILDQSKDINRKFENYARRHAYRKALSLEDIVEAFKLGLSSLYEMSQHFELSESHIQDILNYYKTKHGMSVMRDEYLIQFEPLRVFEYKNVD